MLFHEAIAKALADHGVTKVFCLLGDANLFMGDSFERVAGGRLYSVAHEATAVLAANAYARSTGELGVATVTHGPGLTNTITALVESVLERTPLLLIAGDTAVVDKDNLQNISQRDVVVPTGAGFEQIRSLETACEDVAVAIQRAFDEQRPIVLNMPIEYQWQDIVYTPPVRPRCYPAVPLSPSASALDDALRIIASAERPVVLAGRGAWGEDARSALARLANRIGAPLATTLRARDLFRGEPYNLGICGPVAHEVGRDTITNADCFISFGASLNNWTTSEGAVDDGRMLEGKNMFNGKAVIQVDSDIAALARHQAVDAAIQGDAAAVANAIIEKLDEADVKPSGYASPELAQRLLSHSEQASEDVSTAQGVDVQSAIVRIDKAFPEDRSLVFDAGRFLFLSYTMFHVQHPRDYHHTANFGSIGLGMGNAIGAAAGSGKPTLLVTGDGGFMLGGLTEFNTAVRHGLDLVVVVFNDGAYGTEHIQFRAKDLDPSVTEFDWPDFGPVADALGGKGYTVRNLVELDAVLGELPHRDRPVLIDIKLDPYCVPRRTR